MSEPEKTESPAETPAEKTAETPAPEKILVETPAETPAKPPELAQAEQRALHFAQALVHEDDLPENQIRVFGASVVAIAPDPVELDRIVAAILLTPARARFRDVCVARAVDPSVALEFERDAPAVVVAREKLWRILRQLDDEIAQTESAARCMPKGAPGQQPAREFLGKLQDVRGQIARYHALCYANTLMESHERITAAVIRRSVHVARSAGIKVSFQE
jgi:hypothetical protein